MKASITRLLTILILSSVTSLSAMPVIHFEEQITDSVTHRFTRAADSDAGIIWDETLPGDSLFNTPTDSLTYFHSVEGIVPKLLPDGIIKRVSLKLYLKNRHGEDLLVTADSLSLDKVHCRHFLISADDDDSLTVQQTLLQDGKVQITIVASSDRDDGDDEDDYGDDKSNDAAPVISDDDDDRDHDKDDNRFVLSRSVLIVRYEPAVITGVDDENTLLPSNTELRANYPNPFNPSTTIDYALRTRSRVSIAIYNIRGQLVQTLIDSDMPAGVHTVQWDGTDNSGHHVASGLYFYRIEAGSYINARKMILLK